MASSELVMTVLSIRTDVDSAKTVSGAAQTSPAVCAYLCTPLYKWFTDSKATLYFSQHPGSLLYMGLGSVLLMAMLLMSEQDLVLVAEFFLPLEIDELHCNPSVELMRCFFSSALQHRR